MMGVDAMREAMEADMGNDLINKRQSEMKDLE